MLKQKVFQERLAAGVKQAALLVIISLVLGVSFQAVRSDKIPWVGSWTTLSTTTQSLQGVADISLSEAFALYRDHRALFLDARDPWSFEEGHLAGAVHIEPQDAGKQTAEIQKRAGGRQIIAYCDGAECHLGVDLAKALEKQGISSVKVLINGWSRWREAGYPVEKGKP
jgi:rhodanese-related sulfurtransferase